MKRFIVLCLFVVTAVFGGAAFAQAGLTKIADNAYSYVAAKDASPQDADAVAAELNKALPKRSQAEWMIAFNLKSRYLRKE